METTYGRFERPSSTFSSTSPQEFLPYPVILSPSPFPEWRRQSPSSAPPAEAFPGYPVIPKYPDTPPEPVPAAHCAAPPYPPPHCAAPPFPSPQETGWLPPHLSTQSQSSLTFINVQDIGTSSQCPEQWVPGPHPPLTYHTDWGVEQQQHAGIFACHQTFTSEYLPSGYHSHYTYSITSTSYTPARTLPPPPLETMLVEAENLTGISGMLWKLIRSPTNFQKVEDLVAETREKAGDYCDLVLPKSIELVAIIETALRVYQELDFTTFQGNLYSIIREAAGFHKRAQVIADTHIKASAVSKQLREKARMLKDPVRKYIEEQRRQCQKHKLRASMHRYLGWGFVVALPLAAVPADLSGASGFASVGAGLGSGVLKNFFGKKQEAQTLKAEDAEKHAQEAEQALNVLQVDLDHCLQGFERAMVGCADFFSWLMTELRGFERSTMYGASAYHFQMMQSCTPRILNACERFTQIATRVQMDLRAVDRNTTFVKSVSSWQKEHLLPPPSHEALCWTSS